MATNDATGPPAPGAVPAGPGFTPEVPAARTIHPRKARRLLKVNPMNRLISTSARPAETAAIPPEPVRASPSSTPIRA